METKISILNHTLKKCVKNHKKYKKYYNVLQLPKIAK